MTSPVIKRSCRGGALLAVFGLSALHVHGAVVPQTNDQMGGGAGLRAGLLAPSMAGVAGQWEGRTSTGGRVALVLRVARGAVEGDAMLDGVVVQSESGPRPLVMPTVTGRTMAFAVRSGPCAKSLAHGQVTFMSAERAQLDLQAGRTPISVLLNKVG